MFQMMFCFQCTEVNHITITWFYVNSVNSQGKTLLEMIVDRKLTNNSATEKPMIEALITAGADVLKVDEDGRSIAAKLIIKYRDSDLTIKCLKKIKNINTLLSRRAGHTALFEAIFLGDEKILNYVLGRRPNFNIGRSDGDGPLHWAVRYKRRNILRILLQRGLNVNVKNLDGETPLFYGLHYGYSTIEIVNLLLEYRADLTAVTNRGRTVLHALFSPHEDMDLDICKLLLESGCNPNFLDTAYYTPLHFAMENLKNGTDEDVRNSIKLIKIFIQYGANLNVQNWHGDSMLHTISKFKSSCCLQVLNFLVSKGIETDIVNDANETFWDVLKNTSEDGISRVQKLVGHLVLLESMNQYVFKENPLLSIPAEETLSRIVSTCRKEITYLKKNTLSPDLSITWYSMLSFDEKKLAKFCRNQKVRLLMAEFKMERFPVFGNRLRNRYNVGFRRFEAETAASEVIWKRFNGNLQDLSICRVMRYLPTAILEEMSTFSA